jgi:hypothetical protein
MSKKPKSFEKVLAVFKSELKKTAKKLKKGMDNVTPADFYSSCKDKITEWEIRKYGGFTKMVEISIQKSEPHPLENFTKQGIGEIVKKNNYKEGIFFITAVAPTSYVDWTEDQIKKAQQGQDVVANNLHVPAFKAVGNFCKRNKAELVLLPMPAHVKALHSQPTHYDPQLEPFMGCFATEYTFNTHLKAIEAHINPQQINPLTGLKRLRVHRTDSSGNKGAEITTKKLKTSIIVAHSKQMMDVVPTGIETHPRIIHSTGAITKPAYLKNRIGMIANEDHKLGGLIIEIEKDIFHIRQVQFDPSDGSFVDLATRYFSDGTTKFERAEAFKMGDLHPGYEDQSVLNAHYRLWNKIKPKRIFLEDFFDGASISHHTEKKKLTRAKLPEKFKDLPSEIEEAKRVLKELIDHAPKDCEIFATASNHPDHVMRYLDEGRYIYDIKPNYVMAHRMIVMSLDGKNPLKEFLDPENKMRWTNENEDIFIEGVQMNAHGHLGSNGSRGGKINHEMALGNAMVAHSHTPSIYHDLYTVGHTSIGRHGYNNGPSTWIPASGAVYKRGQKQLYLFIQGKYTKD